MDAVSLNTSSVHYLPLSVLDATNGGNLDLLGNGAQRNGGADVGVAMSVEVSVLSG